MKSKGDDNTVQAEKANPSLSSVEADAGMLGVRAVEVLLRMLSGEQVENETLPTKFIRRDSFGVSWNKRELENDELLLRENVDKHFENIFYRCLGHQEETMIRLLFKGIMDLVIGCYEVHNSTEMDARVLDTMLDNMLLHGSLNYVDMQQLLNYIEGIYQSFLKHMEKEDVLVSKIGAVYRKILLGEEQSQGEMIVKNEQKDFDLKTFVMATMQFENGNDSGYGILVEHLEWLDIKNAYLCMYEKPIAHLYQEAFELPEKFYVKASLESGKVRKRAGIAKKSSIVDFMNTVMSRKTGSAKVVLPIFTNETLYGVLICDMTEKIYENGEFLASQIGAAAKMLYLLKVNEDIQAQNEESLRVLHQNNVELDVLAKSDALTEILNRRGFLEACERKLAGNRQENRDALVLYIDMNNLKIINDRYGHEEGDYSIKTIASILKKNFPEEIVGRIGGDEFALLYSGDEHLDGNEIIQKVYKLFDEFNINSSKAYNITVSAGACPIYANVKIELQDALAIADEKLYVDKQKRVKNVVKA